MDYSLSFWTLVDDSPNPIAYGCKTYPDLYLKLMEMGVTGFITEFPENCFTSLKEYQAKVEEESKKKK